MLGLLYNNHLSNLLYCSELALNLMMMMLMMMMMGLDDGMLEVGEDAGRRPSSGSVSLKSQEGSSSKRNDVYYVNDNNGGVLCVGSYDLRSEMTENGLKARACCNEFLYVCHHDVSSSGAFLSIKRDNKQLLTPLDDDGPRQ